MPRLSPAQQQVRHTIERLSASGLTPPDLGDRIMAALGQAVPNDGYRLFGIDPDTLLINRLFAASDSDAWAREEWIREVYLASEPLTYIELPTLMRLGLSAVTVQERKDHCWGYPTDVLDLLSDQQHYSAYHELRSPVGGTLFGCLRDGNRWVAAMQVYRREGSRPFSKSDVAFLRMLAPTIGRSLSTALIRERSFTDVISGGPDASGVLIVEPNGDVRFSSPAGERWCNLLNASDRDRHDLVPGAVWSAIARARTDTAATGRLLVPTRAGAVQVEASPSGTDGSHAIVIAPQRQPSIPALPAGWSLTSQEERIVELVLHGMSNRQIAATLFVTENTVQTHLRHIYDKLEVGSRTQLLSRYFHEVFRITDVSTLQPSPVLIPA